MRLLPILALLVGSCGSCLAQQDLQDLPATVRVQQHHFYAALSMGSIANLQQVTSNGLRYQPISQNRGVAVGGLLGYNFSPTMALELGAFALRSQNGYRFQLSELHFEEEKHFQRTYAYFPVHVVARVWQPAARLAVRAVVGGGLAVVPELYGSYDYSTTYTDTLASPTRQLLFRYTGSRTRNVVVAELGLRVDWQLWRNVMVGLDVTEQRGLGTPFRQDVINLTDSASPTTPSMVQLTSQLRSTSVSLSARLNFNSPAKYRYRPMPSGSN